jgi:hypothetical protein
VNKHKAPINPASFVDALTEQLYAQKSAKGRSLKGEREELIDWLRKKARDNQQAQALADKLEECRRKRRCKSGTCPECVDAARRLFSKTLRRYLKNKPNVACITIVPADGIAKKGTLL